MIIMQISYTVTMNNKGQITIPAEIRREMGFGDNDSFMIGKAADGSLALKKKKSFLEMLESLPRPKTKIKPMSNKKMRELVGKALAEDDARIMREYNQ